MPRLIKKDEDGAAETGVMEGSSSSSAEAVLLEKGEKEDEDDVAPLPLSPSMNPNTITTAVTAVATAAATKQQQQQKEKEEEEQSSSSSSSCIPPPMLPPTSTTKNTNAVAVAETTMTIETTNNDETMTNDVDAAADIETEIAKNTTKGAGIETIEDVATHSKSQPHNNNNNNNNNNNDDDDDNNDTSSSLAASLPKIPSLPTIPKSPKPPTASHPRRRRTSSTIAAAKVKERAEFTAQQKIQILSELDAPHPPTIKSLLKKYGVSKSSFHRWRQKGTKRRLEEMVNMDNVDEMDNNNNGDEDDDDGQESSLSVSAQTRALESTIAIHNNETNTSNSNKDNKDNTTTTIITNNNNKQTLNLLLSNNRSHKKRDVKDKLLKLKYQLHQFYYNNLLKDPNQELLDGNGELVGGQGDGGQLQVTSTVIQIVAGELRNGLLKEYENWSSLLEEEKNKEKGMDKVQEHHHGKGFLSEEEVVALKEFKASKSWACDFCNQLTRAFAHVNVNVNASSVNDDDAIAVVNFTSSKANDEMMVEDIEAEANIQANVEADAGNDEAEATSTLFTPITTTTTKQHTQTQTQTQTTPIQTQIRTPTPKIWSKQAKLNTQQYVSKHLPPPKPKKQRLEFTAQEKINILQQFDLPENKSLTIDQLCKKYDTSKSSLHRWKQQYKNQKLQTMVKSSTKGGNCKRILPDKLHRVKSALCDFYTENESLPPQQRVPIGYTLLQHKALVAKQSLLMQHYEQLQQQQSQSQSQQPLHGFLNEEEVVALESFKASSSWVREVAKKFGWKMDAVNNDVAIVENVVIGGGNVGDVGDRSSTMHDASYAMEHHIPAVDATSIDVNGYDVDNNAIAVAGSEEGAVHSIQVSLSESVYYDDVGRGYSEKEAGVQNHGSLMNATSMAESMLDPLGDATVEQI